jgi:cyclic beta-1,2-glucan synthetase
LSETITWDAPTALRGEIQTADRLVEHAVEVARAHGPPITRRAPGPLRLRFSSAKARIREAYEILSREARANAEPSPAEEWLLDNSHVVEDQIREIQEDLPAGYLAKLPRIAHGAMKDFPRVYGLCIDYLRHTDAHIDIETLARYTNAYQSVSTLAIGELWAIPIMLRLGLLLTVGALASSEASERDRARANTWANSLIAGAHTSRDVARMLDELEHDDPPITATLLVELLRRLREHDVPLSAATKWLRPRCRQMHTTPEELSRKEHLRQAADQVSVGNAVTSMRTIAALDWNVFFERTSAVEAILRRDPTRTYEAMDDRTRDSYRRTVERLARRCPHDETSVAQKALDLAKRAHRADAADEVRSHIGYWLVDDGRAHLERRIAYAPSVRRRISRTLLAHPSIFFLGAILSITAALVALVAWIAGGWIAALFALPASEIAVGLVNALATAILRPRVLPKLELDKGIPSDRRTLVVVPALIDSRATVRRLLEGLEIRALANPGKNLHFALLTDFVDHKEESAAEDAALLDEVRRGITALGEQYGKDDHRFILMHRRRVRSATQGCFLGWERKRGKLEELNRLLRGATDTTFNLVTAPAELLARVRYVITLDADTELPRDVAQRLVATLAHPLVEPRVDASARRMIRGHAIIQPRVGTLPTTARKSRYARALAGPSGIDPYTTACSDVYQDWFGEGAFVGKGIYDVDAFVAVMRGRAPEERILSHDLFEGTHARCALASDIEVLDEQPPSHAIASARDHRWVRGDWQLVPFLFRGDLRAFDVWRIVDNLRRSLLAPSIVLACAIAWMMGVKTAALATAFVGALFALPIVTRAIVSLVRTPRGTWGSAERNAVQSLVRLVYMLDRAVIASDAIVRTAFRLAITKRRLLEWTTTSQTTRAFERARVATNPRLALAAAIALAFAALVARRSTESLFVALPILALWILAPALDVWLSAPLRAAKRREAGIAERRLMRSIARKTWLFFEEFVGELDHHLPPDNFQEAPRGVVAHRTSPTNMGLYLISIVAARDFGFITLREMEQRLARTLGTIESLERHDGHVLNWYDTKTLAPLSPRYVSTVDSGNLAAYLWALREACVDVANGPIVSASTVSAFLDAARLAPANATTKRVIVRAEKTIVGDDLASVARALAELHDAAAAVSADRDDPARWFERAVIGLADARGELATLAPFTEVLAHTPESISSDARGRALLAIFARARSPRDVLAIHDDAIAAIDAFGAMEGAAEWLASLRESLDRSAEQCGALVDALGVIGARANALADGMRFGFLYDESRELFAIGYNADTAQLDRSHYDLLASEARLASFIAIASGDVPQEHWFKLARPRTAIAGHRHALLSWSGSMFEYLMPLLVTKSYGDTLLSETYEGAVERQREYGEEHSVPWGVSESAFNVMDLGLTYQYRGFGVPGLGLKAGLAEDLVVAPYATALAALVRPELAAKNFRALARTQGECRYGFYDAVDFTKSHVPPKRSFAIVKTMMAHHQGMILVALDNALHDDVMQERFHRDARVKATELLLEERVPTNAPLTTARASVMPAPPPTFIDYDAVEHVGLRSDALTRVHLLGHGELTTIVTAAGEGVTTWRGIDVYRFREDRSLEAGGIYMYVRNHTTRERWSAGYQPMRVEPASYMASFAIDRVTLTRRDGHIETVTEVVVSPEHPVEVRRFTFTNHGDTPCDLDVTTYTELVLAPRADDVAHRAFGSLFIETEVLRDRGAVLAHFRPKSPHDPSTWVAQVLVPEGGEWEGFEFDTSRARFLGRGRTTTNPASLDEPLGENVGTVIDPAIALRRGLRLAPKTHARLTLATAMATSREEAIKLVDTYATPNALPRALELAWADARVELKHLGVDAPRAHRFQRLLSCVLFPHPALRAMPDRATIEPRGRNALWAYGVSGDLPIVVLRVDAAEFSDLMRELLLAHEFWRINGASVDLVVLNEEPAGYMQPFQDAALSILRASPAGSQQGTRGGVFLRRASEMAPADRTVLLCVARVVLVASRGSLARQLRRVAVSGRPPATIAAPKRAAATPHLPPHESPHANGLGEMRDGGREYVMTLGPDTRTPLPWCNVIANEKFGTLVSEAGSSFTWFGNAQRHRLTPWSNDAVRDPSGEIFYARDDQDGSWWSLTPEPAGGSATYTVAHGQGYSRFAHTRRDVEYTMTTFVDKNDPVKIVRVRATNRGAKPASLSLFGVVDWVLGRTRETTRVSVVTEWDAANGAIYAVNPLSHFPERHAFFTAAGSIRSATSDREEFFGVTSSRSRPAALSRVALSGKMGAGLDPCGALQVPVKIEPGATVEIAFVLGDADGEDHARSLVTKYRAMDEVARAETDATQSWNDLLGAVRVRTPDAALDALVNRWLLYQVTSARLWGRTAFYQSSGAYGFRDQLQDVLALLHARPSLARDHIVRAAHRQFPEGDVQHWWHPGTGEGIRTRCSDDMLWLPYVTAEYVRVTGDIGILDESITFLKERTLTESDEDLFSSPPSEGGSASLYDHCARALDAGATSGEHDLPLMRAGDWNDGMNRIGRLGKGESVWLAWFLASTLAAFEPIAKARGDETRAKWCRDRIARLATAVDAHAWDGDWYRRAFFDDGAVLGSRDGDECKVDAIAQSWAVIAGIGDRDRARRALRSSIAELVRPEVRLMRLLWPPFDRTVHDPGYIRAYPNGIRENGGQYTHGVLWTVRALAMLGEGDEAMRLLGMFDPQNHARTPEDVARYRVEPYVVAADVYDARGHVGRGGWTWYTGAAGWMYRIILEDVLGVRKRGDHVVIDPCVPKAWKRYEIDYATLHVVVENPNGVEHGVVRVEIDGHESTSREAPLDGAPHEVRVVMG